MANDHWYVLKVASGREEKVKLSILVELKVRGVEKYVVDIMVPSEKVYDVKDGKRKLKQKVFFPGYVFVCISSLTEGVRVALRNVSGVLGFLDGRKWSWGMEPLVMNYRDAFGMLAMGNGALVNLQLEHVFSVGDAVMIIDGPFKGFSGKVEKVSRDRKKVNVAVSIFDRLAPVELNYAQVELYKQ